jgi:hypothetical protein
MTTQTTTTQTVTKKPFAKRITPLGWIFVACFAVLAVGLVGLALRPLTYPIRSLPTGAEALSTAPTITPYTEPTQTVAPTQTPLPDGWTQAQALDGKLMYVPGEADRVQIVTAFDSVWHCNFVDAAEREPVKQSRDEVCAEAALVAPNLALGNGNAREMITAGPLNQPQCTDITHCQVARAKLAVRGAVMDGDICQQIKKNSPCVITEGITGLHPYQLQIATIVKEDNAWRVSAWKTEQLPGPLPTP